MGLKRTTQPIMLNRLEHGADSGRLAVGAPAPEAVAGFDEINFGEVRWAARGIEARGHFVSERLVVDKTVLRGPSG
jgi:hypothetical protein